MRKILQLKISLNEIKPEIWRRFLVEDSISFKQFHKTIQRVMGWEDYHLYEFCIGDEKIAPEEEGFNLAEAGFRDLHNSPEFIDMLQKQDMSKGPVSLDPDKLNEILQKIKQNKPKKRFNLNTKISELLTSEKQKFTYTYDFGDSWEHSITIENIKDKAPLVKYPICIEGKRACPPEDCGSVSGYHHLMKIRQNKKHPEYKERIVEWLGEDFDPELFVIDWVNARLHGKKPVPIWVNKKTDEKDEFVLLGNLLKEDNDSVKKIKTLFNREEKYEAYLGEIEFTIANYFLENRGLKDKDVKLAIKNIKENYLQKIDFFEIEIEKEIMLNLSLAIQEESITHHELKLVFEYILWCIDNRSWMPDKQAFVKWLPYFFDLYEEDEMSKYKLNLTKICRRMKVPKDKLDALLNIEKAEISDQEKDMSKLESEFSSLEDDKKFDFVVENAITNPYLAQPYLMELYDKEDFESVERLCKKLMELSNNFPMFEFLLGLNYNYMKNPTLAKHHMENAVKALEEAPSDFFPHGEGEKILNDMKIAMKKVS